MINRALRNELRHAVTKCRKLLEAAVGDQLEGRLGVKRDGRIEDADRMGHLSKPETRHRGQVISHLRHVEAGGFGPADAVAQLIREIAYTHLNRLCAYKMLERRRLIREAVGRGLNSNGLKFYLADHPEDEQRWSSGEQDVAYRNFLGWLGGELSGEIGALFSPNDPAEHLFPPQRTLDAVLDLVNAEELDGVWNEEEAIGWVYQYYTPKELRDQARKESQAPRNSYELSFRNPRRFFDFHVKRYSKSRRKAPIYWLLQSPKRSYGLWLYYHRLDPDLPFKALTKYVEPKIRREENELNGLRSQLRGAGEGGGEARQIGRAVEELEAFLADLREFRDRLDRAAKLYLYPDLNDGVVLNAAPLHELMPWKEAKGKWGELLAGKYEWSSIGKQLRQKGMV